MANLLRLEDLVNNPTPRVPICLCLDTSGSMGEVISGVYEQTGKTIFRDGKEYTLVTGDCTTKIAELQAGIEKFYAALKADDIAVYSAEISIVTFDFSAKCIEDFASLERQEKIPELKADGNTAMGEGVNLALDLLEERKKEYSDKGVDYYQPWLVLMTDGEANGNPSELERAVQRTSELVNNGKLTVFPIAIGSEAGINTLNRFSPKQTALRLRDMNFAAFFAWLSQSVAKVSQSMPGETFTLSLDDIEDWADL